MDSRFRGNDGEKEAHVRDTKHTRDTPMNRFAFLLVTIAAVLGARDASAIDVFACEPEWGALVHELAGDAINVDVGTTALQDVHVIEAKPSLIAKVRHADLVVCTGADLEIGWLPQLIKQAGNPKVASGSGYFLASDQITTLEKPSKLDRSEGDIHAQGNPHFQMDPYRILAIAKALAARLAELDPANAATYQQHLADFTTRWQTAIKGWETKA